MGPADAPDDEMRRPFRNPVPPLDPMMVDRMLDGAVAAEDVPPDYRDVLAVLAAAAAPAAPAPAAEAAALAAFRSTRRPVDPPRRTSVFSKLLGAKALAAVVLGTASVGTAAAAATGTLPGPAQAAAHRVVPAVPDSGRAEPAAERGNAGKAAAGHGTLPGALGLCRAHASGRGGEHGARADAAGFQRLAEAAGGPAGVAAYCAKVLAAAPAAGAEADAALQGACRAWLAADRQGRTAELGKATLDRLTTAAGAADAVAAYCTELVEPVPAGQAPRPAESSPAKAGSPGSDARVDRGAPSSPARPTPRG